MTWKRDHYLDLLAAASFLLAGLAFVISSTVRPQYGASQAMPALLGVLIAAGFGATLFSAWKRWAPKATAAPESEAAAAATPDPKMDPQT